MSQSPELLPRTNDHFRGGYGARAIALSRDGATLFVGCKDGSITAIDLKRAIREEEAYDGQLTVPKGDGKTAPAGVRAIYDCGQGWLLVGDDRGSISLMKWEEPDRGVLHRLYTLETSVRKEEFSPVTLIEAWDASGPCLSVVVSVRHGATEVLNLELTSTDDPAGPPLRLASKRTFPQARAVCGILRDGPCRLLVSESGDLWVVKGDGNAVEPMKAGFPAPWKRLGKPGLISDIAPMQDLGGSGSGDGIYFSSDEGVFHLRFQAEPPDLEVEEELLPGFTGMSMAVSQAVLGKGVVLWVADLIGDVGLFWRSRTEPGETLSPWRRLGSRLESSQVIRSIATTLPVDGKDVLVLGQACRSDRIVVTWYPQEPAGETDNPLFALAHLLSSGTWEQLKKRSKSNTWAPEACIANLFEEAGEHPDELTYFLANPTTRLSWSVLLEIAREGPQGRAAEAILTWTYALIGTIHRRMSERSAQHFLGVIRWLRRLSDRCAEPGPEWHQEVAEAIERAIQQVRKWGIFGNTYYERQEVERPLEALQYWKEDYRKFDHIVYSSLLFGRRTNLEVEFPADPRGPLTPWDVRYLSLPSEGGSLRQLVAVSWRERIELYERDSFQDGRATKWVQIWPEDRKAIPPLKIEPVEDFSRKIMMGTASRNGAVQPYILESPAKEKGPEFFRLWWIDPKPGGKVERGNVTPEASASLEPQESVFSFLDLAPGLVLVGLQVGHQKDKEVRERLPLVVVRTTSEGGFQILRCSDPKARLPSVNPDTRTIESQRNPVLALARDPEDTAQEDRYTVVVGRGDGQILRISIRVPQDESCFHLEGGGARVGRLGSPVRSLIYQSARTDPTGSREPRVFAGAADGTLVAFQEVESAFATLWATREDGPIARLHLCEQGLPPEEGGGMDLVLAVTQKGMAILFLNSSQVEPPRPDWNDHHRLRIPGERLGRFTLGTNVFGSALVEQESLAERWESFRKNGMMARLVVATGKGTLRILTLHYPKYTDSRRKVYIQIRKDWLSILKTPDGRINVSLLRKVEAMYAAVPYLPSIFVRWILSSKPTKQSWADRVGGKWPGENPHQWIPRHLQALVELDKAWSAGASLKGKVKAALLDAWKVGDLRLFKEIVEVILRRANEQLFRQALQLEQKEPEFATQFVEIMKDLDEMKGVWLGGSGDIDTKIRVVFAKCLVDGDTLWSLACMLGGETHLLMSEGSQTGNPFRIAMKARVEQLHRFLAAGDPLLALETLRAANLAIFRACCRLLDKQGGIHRRDLHWDSIQGYFEAVGDFAARVAHSGRADMTEAVAHEICRAYAIGMLACPPRTYRLLHMICEADLPREFGSGVHLQLRIVEKLLGSPLPEKPRSLVDAVISKLQSPEGDHATLLASTQRAWGDQEDDGSLGLDNWTLIRESVSFDSLLEWLGRMAQALASDAFDIGLHEAWTRLEDLSKGKYEQFIHSGQFWTEALETLVKRLEAAGYSKSKLAAIHENQRSHPTTRPDLVLFSRQLAIWCGEQRERLRGLKEGYDIFEPQYSMYVRALDRLRVAATGFPHGAALQKNMVLGVLGHSLLELLDEHLLELWEIAQVLDPKQTWDQEDRNPDEADRTDAPDSRAGQFASDLLSTASKAELIPKNLRNLQGFLSYPARPEEARIPVGDLLRELKGWELPSSLPEKKISKRSYHFLQLMLRELAQNQRTHSRSKAVPSVSLLASQPLQIRIEFPYHDTDGKLLERLNDVVEQSENLQVPVEPKKEPDSQSHGAGLYLANLAAAAAGWKLKIEDLYEVPGRLRFLLSCEHSDE